MNDPETKSAADPSGMKEVRAWKLGRTVLACRVAPTGRYVVAGEMDTRITQFDLTETPEKEAVDSETPEAKKKSTDALSPGVVVNKATSWIASLTFSPDGDRLYSSDHTGLLLAWKFPLESPDQSPEWIRQAHTGCLRVIAVSPDSQLLATCGNDDQVRLWSSATGEPAGDFPAHDSDVYQVAFHPSGTELVSADLTGTIRHWNLGTGKLVRELDLKTLFKEEGPIRAGGPRSMAFNSDGTMLACGGLGQIKQVNSPKGVATVVVFDWKSGQHRYTLLPKSRTDGFVNGVAFHPDGYVIGVTGGASSRAGIFLFWRIPTEEPELAETSKPPDTNTARNSKPTTPVEVTSFHQFKTPTSAWAMDLHPNNRHVIAAHHDATLRQYDLSSAEPVPNEKR